MGLTILTSRNARGAPRGSRRGRVLAACLLVAAIGAVSAACSGSAKAKRTEPAGLDQVIPAVASAEPSGGPFELKQGASIRVPADAEARRVGEQLAGLLAPRQGSTCRW
jgi:hypothetical protein